MKKIKDEKRFYTKLAAIVLGLIIWTILINVEDADFSANINDVPVQLSGETVLEHNGLIVSNKGELADASVSVRGKRSDVINYMDDIYAVADLSRITEPGEYNLRLSYESGTNTLYMTERKTTVKVIVEKLQEKELELIAVQQGVPVDAGKLIASVPKVKKLTVKGAAADVEKISRAAVIVDITNMLVDSEIELPVVAVDSENKPISFKNSIYMDVTEAKVTNTMYSKLTVPVKVEIESDERLAVIIENQSLEKIDVGVEEGTELDEITAKVKYDEADGNEYSAELTAPEGVYIPRESRVVKVKLKVTPKVKRTLTVPLEIKDKQGRKVTAPGQINIEVTGAEEEIGTGNITASIELEGVAAGVHTLPVQVKFEKTSLSLVGLPQVTVTIE